MRRAELEKLFSFLILLSCTAGNVLRQLRTLKRVFIFLRELFVHGFLYLICCTFVYKKYSFMYIFENFFLDRLEISTRFVLFRGGGG